MEDEFRTNDPRSTHVIEADQVDLKIGRLEITADANGRPMLLLDGNEVKKVTELHIQGGIDDVWRWRATIESIIDPRLQDKSEAST